MIHDEDNRIQVMMGLLINHLQDEVPEIGGKAMAYLLASHTKDNREEFLKQMGYLWDHYHTEKNERT